MKGMIYMKKIALGFGIGAVVCMTIGVLAAYTTHDVDNNPYPITLNGSPIELQGYNIDGNTYFQLRDIAAKVGGFTVDFNDNTILLTTDTQAAPAKTAPQNADGDIGVDKAKEIALNEAGLTADGVTFTKSFLDMDDGVLQYEIEFITGDAEYSADVKASDGTILKWDVDRNHSAASPSQGDIGVDKAKEIAAKKAGFAVSDVTFVKERLDIDNGIRQYEIEFIKDNTEYSADVSASDGTILDWDEDRGKAIVPPSTAPDASAGGAGEITADKAKEIALQKAGFNESDVTGLRVEYDRDDRVNKYDVEFRNGRNEYSVEVRAADGEIMEYDVDD